MANVSLTKDNIMKLIKNNDSCLTFLKPKSTSLQLSHVWSSFSYIYFNNYKQNFVACDDCKEVLHHTSSNGTSSMAKHKKVCSKIATNNNDHRSIREYFGTTTQSVPRKIKEKITVACTEFVILDNRPFQLICGDGFLNLAETIFSVGRSMSTLSNINIEDLLPNPTTISRNIDRMFSYRKSQLMDLCKAMKWYTVVVDFWTDSHSGVKFCGIALRHLTSELQLQNFILGCYPYDFESHSAVQVRQFVDSKLAEFHLKLDNEIFVVTDNENLMKAAFKESCSRIGCSIHYVNKQLEHAFMTKEIDKVKVNCNIAQEMFFNIRKIVAHMTRSHKQSKLSHKIQSYTETRFNSAFITMDVVLLLFDELITVLDSSFVTYYLSIDKEFLQSICSFLKPFQTVFDELSNDTVPTIHKVLPLREYLLNHCRVNSDDNGGMQEIKIFLELRTRNIWILHDVHFITTLLHPSFKNFHINPDLKMKAIDLVKKEILQRFSSTIDNNNSNTPATQDTQSTSSKTLLSKCFDLPSTTSKSSSTPLDELTEYMNLDIRLNEDDNILSFWLQHQSKFPVLASIVQKFYTIPATNISVERLFSSSKSTLNDRRTRLGLEKVNKLMFLQKNLQVLKKLDTTTANIDVEVQVKRKNTELPSSSSSHENQEQSMSTASAKKFKLIKQDNICISDEDDIEGEKENDAVDFF